MLIKDLYNQGRTVVSFEVFPPKKEEDIEGVQGALKEMSALSPDFMSVTYGAGGSGNTKKTSGIASFILNNCGIETMAHLTCVGADKEQIDRALEEFHDGGIRNILALRGDLPESEAREGDYAYAEELIREIRKRGDFCVGAACYPEGHVDCDSIEQDAEYMRRKQDAGADFLITQLCFDNEIICRFLDRAKKHGVTIPISVGIMPIMGQSQIERMVFMCGVTLPSVVVKLLHKYEKNPSDLYKAGVEYAASQIDGLVSHGVDGIHIYSLNRPDIAKLCFKRASGK